MPDVPLALDDAVTKSASRTIEQPSDEALSKDATANGAIGGGGEGGEGGSKEIDSHAKGLFSMQLPSYLPDGRGASDGRWVAGTPIESSSKREVAAGCARQEHGQDGVGECGR